jgi:hypothetical protein
MKPARAALLLAALLAPAARADESLGIQLVREARRRWPPATSQGAGAAEQAHGVDRLARRGNRAATRCRGPYRRGASEYDRRSGPEAHHAHFTAPSRRTCRRARALNQAGVGRRRRAARRPQPGDVAGPVAAPRASSRRATTSFRARLRTSRRRESGRLNRRLDALTVEDERGGADQDKQKDDQKKDDKQDKQDPKDQKDQTTSRRISSSRTSSSRTRKPQDQKPQDQPPQDQQDQPRTRTRRQDQQDQQNASPKDQQSQPQSARELSEEEVQRLLDKLARLEEEARQRQKAREIAGRRAVEKDW